MKRVLFILMFMAALAVIKAQIPDNWTGDTGIETFQEMDEVHGGSNSCGVIVNTATQAECDLTNNVELAVSAGDDFKVSFWAYTSAHVRATVALDWVGASSQYPGSYVGPATGGWSQFSFDDIVPDGATGVKLRIRFYDVSGFAPGEIQYVDDVEFESPLGEPLSVANGNFEAWPTIKPEPTNYPTDFAASAVGLNGVITWTDAIGDNLPDAYLIKISTQNNIADPVDGVYEPDDTDLSDGNGAANVNYGQQGFTFTGLMPQTAYFIKIHPYTNSGTNINFKTDGVAPSAQIQTGFIVTIVSENFDEGWGGWETVSVVGDQVWSRDNTYGIGSTPCAQMSGFASGTDFENEDWLISPAMNFDDYDNEIFTFYSALGYPVTPHQLLVKYSNNYEGGDPNEADWTDLDPILPSGDPYWQFTYSGELDVSTLNGTNVRVAFVYLSDGSDSETWEIDNVVVTGEGEFVVDPEPTNYPTSFEAEGVGQSINLTWMDATGEVVPTGYLIKASDMNNITLPVDGSPVGDDTDLSDGQGAINIGAGVEAYSFSGLDPMTTYYFMIVPYTNSGLYIDFKTDGIPPQAEATTSVSNVVDVLFTTFDANWENWQQVSVTGTQVWDRNNTFGINQTACAKMSGYANQASNENEDWLISPAVDLSAYAGEKLIFNTATGYTGPALQVKISTNYSGSGNPNNATWADLSGNAIWPTGTTFFEWTNSGEISISNWGSGVAYVAFIYTSNTTNSATWEVDEIKITGESSSQPLPEPTNYPSAFQAAATGQSIATSWTDATGEVVPTGYLIKISKTNNITLAVDGTPVDNDTDLSDGKGAMNIVAGVGNYTFAGLEATTTYYFMIFPYTNSGSLIDYKTSDYPPQVEATTGVSQIVEILNTTFNDGWENWTKYSVSGDQMWDRDLTHGVGSTPCAKMSGYASSANHANEDWLISPQLNLENYMNEKFSFFTATGYTGNPLAVLVSSNYDGTGNPNDFTWTDLSSEATWPTGDPFWQWTGSGEISISAFAENQVYFAFKYTSTDAASATWEVDDVVVKGEEKVGIGETFGQSTISVYPNPGNGIFNFSLDNPVDKIQIYSVNGSLVFEQPLSVQLFSLNLSQLEKGLYFVKFSDENSGSYLISKIVVN